MKGQLVVLSNRDQDALAIGELYRKARGCVVDSVRYLIEVGQRLTQKKMELSHGAWLPWLTGNAEVLGFDDRKTASRLMAVARKWGASAPFAETEAIEINRLVWGHNVRSTENEWYTPPEYLDLARAVLGEFDLDPASSEAAQRVVRAAKYFNLTDDGLAREWHGRVWLNPPYAQPLIADFVSKLIAEYRAGRVTAAIMLTHNYTGTAWFQKAVDACDAICFPRGRVKFYKPDSEVANPKQGQAVFYFGPDAAVFIQRFRTIGSVVRPCE